jgi:hypothetical protein
VAGELDTGALVVGLDEAEDSDDGVGVVEDTDCDGALVDATSLGLEDGTLTDGIPVWDGVRDGVVWPWLGDDTAGLLDEVREPDGRAELDG